MSTVVIVLRAASLLAFAGPMLLGVSGRRREPNTQARQSGGDRVPVLANFAAFGLFRAELGSAWSFVPMADEGTGLVTTGPYRFVRHPIYLGLALLAMGEALAFSSWPAFMIVLSGIVPTFAWRARAEEKLLSRTFGERYAVYRQRTKMIIPHVL
jgi:protein-S-isoprenylcysteine O-methyltransferase Ste14